MLGFVLVNTAIVGAASWALCRCLPPLRDEPPSLVLLPMIGITLVGSAALHAVVRRLRGSLARAAALYVAFFGALVVFGVHLSLYDGSGSPEQWARLHQSGWDYVRLIPASLIFGHVFGAPVLLVVGLADKLLSPVLTPRPGAARPHA